MQAYGLDTYGLNTYGLDTHGLDTYGLDTYGLDTYGLDTYGPDTYGLDTYGLDTYDLDTYDLDTYGLDTFDSLMPGPMLDALRRFGLPAEFVNMIASIYDSRSFFVRDGKADSNTKSQHAGISQGCPLSPILFVITVSIVIADYRSTLVDFVG